MTPSADLCRELEVLADAWCLGDANEAQTSRLNALLLTDAALRREFLQTVEVHHWLAQGHGEPAAPSNWRRVARWTRERLNTAAGAALLLAGLSITIVLLALALTQTDWLQPQPPVAATTPRPAPVARVLGMQDARWSQASGVLGVGDALFQNQPVLLLSGVVEIEFHNGAVTVLQGPSDFTLRDDATLFLHQGWLTAYVPARALGFQVLTPSAKIVDLGTEFSVAVDSQERTELHVHQGLVEARPAAEGGVAQQVAAGEAVVLLPGEASPRKTVIREQMLLQRPPTGPLRVLDLVDVVAGGDGTGIASERGIDLRTGAVALQFARGEVRSDSAYRPTPDVPFVDGVFLPNGETEPVTLNSAGDTHPLPKTDRTTHGPIWAWGPTHVTPRADRGDWISKIRSENRLLSLHANAGITFDLQALQAAHERHALRSFMATAVNIPEYAAPNKHADLWVFVDGTLRYHRKNIPPSDKQYPIHLPLRPTDRFLTLVSTDGDGSFVYDVVVFHNPRLYLMQTAPNAASP